MEMAFCTDWALYFWFSQFVNLGSTCRLFKNVLLIEVNTTAFFTAIFKVNLCPYKIKWTLAKKRVLHREARIVHQPWLLESSKQKLNFFSFLKATLVTYTVSQMTNVNKNFSATLYIYIYIFMCEKKNPYISFQVNAHRPFTAWG